MPPDVADLHRPLEYGQSHALARSVLPGAVVGILLGLFLLTPLDSATLDRKSALLGGAALALSLAMVGVVIYRSSKPSVPSIVLSPAGVLFRDLSTTVIPWDEIEAIGTAHVRGRRELFSTKVTKLVVSQQFYQSLTGGVWQIGAVGRAGDPSEIYLSYFHSVPFDEFQHAVRVRWQAFSRHAASATRARQSTGSATNGTPDAVVAAGKEERTAPPVNSTPFQLLVIVASLAGIVVLLANHAGLWSTTRQVKARSGAVEWRAWQDKYDADRKATDAEQRRIEELWKRQKW